MKFFKKKAVESPAEDSHIEEVIKTLAELEPRKVERAVALAKSLREYNQKLRNLKKGVEDVPEDVDYMDMELTQ